MVVLYLSRKGKMHKIMCEMIPLLGEGITSVCVLM
jgi:hypothetical protein